MVAYFGNVKDGRRKKRHISDPICGQNIVYMCLWLYDIMKKTHITRHTFKQFVRVTVLRDILFGLL